jgi:Leucine-rich repeat (LRR) protein
LWKNVIEHIESDSFSLLKALNHLNLTLNKIEYIQPDSYYVNLRELNLGDNNLTSIKNYYFKSLRNLVTLDLSFNNIKIIKKDSFADLISLESLNLSYNKNTRINKCIFSSLLSLTNLNLE